MRKCNPLLWLAALWLTACSDEDPYVMEDYIHTDLIPYFESFAMEGKLRGIEVDFTHSGITALFGEFSGTIAGQCTSDETGFREIRIDAGYWRTASQTEKEYVVFHELGHCYLGRSHIDTRDERGRCTSLMNSGLGVCRNAYSPSTRDDYLDELFTR